MSVIVLVFVMISNSKERFRSPAEDPQESCGVAPQNCSWALFPFQSSGSFLNFCFQNGGNLYRTPYYSRNLNIGPRIDSNLGQSPSNNYKFRTMRRPAMKASSNWKTVRSLDYSPSTSSLCSVAGLRCATFKRCSTQGTIPRQADHN